MVAHDQCPSSKKAGFPGKAELEREARELPRLSGTTGRRVWRSLDEYADTPEFRETLEREFPAGASELLASSRRTFLQLMGASLALAGAAVVPGCRRPVHNIMPYAATTPEDVVPGKPLYYASSMPLPGGGAEGVIVETHEGRPTKVEGNPLHPINQGKSSIWSQASVLGLYDPDRLKSPVLRAGASGADEGAYKSWDEFALWAKDHFGSHAGPQGSSLAFLVEKKTSPSRDAMKARVMAHWPRAKWVAYDAGEGRSAGAGLGMALGRPGRPIYNLRRAKVIVTFDADLLECSAGGPAALVHARDFASTRRVLKNTDDMSRLYAAESGFSGTGAAADHRLRLAPSRIAALAVEVAKAVLAKVPGADAGLTAAVNAVGVPSVDGLDRDWINAVADDLTSRDAGHAAREARGRGESVIAAGPTQPAEIHALAAALNRVLGNDEANGTVRYMPASEDEAADSAAGLASLADDLAAGRVTTLVVMGCNPVYDAAPELGFAAAYAKATTVCLSVDDNETARASTWELNGAHWLEAWGDTTAADGTHAPIQPMIAPIYDGKSDLELLSILLGDEHADGHEIVRSAWRERARGDFETFWKRSLHDGVFAGAKVEPIDARADFGRVSSALGGLRLANAPTSNGLEVVFQPSHLYDGRFANHGWLQELPQAGTRVVWDNPALVSPATAAALGVLPVGFTQADPNKVYTTPKYPESRMATITVGGRTLQMSVWILPGMADHTVILPLGYGRTACGKVGSGVGFNTFALRGRDGAAVETGATIAAAGGTYMVASTQTHWSISGRTALVRGVDLAAWQKHSHETPHEHIDKLYKTKSLLSFGERVSHSELTHTPPNLNIYPHPHLQPEGQADPSDTGGLEGRSAEPQPGSAYATRPQWAMSIDLATCTGCGACTIACQAENNIPIVGKKEVAKGREMTWIRVDRYFTGDPNNPDDMLHQPVACVHCENAPCETVCPVNATVHGPEGINYMTYNRCIGTRYCANNCPYKVRRFNYFDFGVAKFKGSYLGEDAVPYFGERNPNLVPPRLRAKLDEITKMGMNPDVTVRSRGVMEKCTYCIQRINAARVEVKLHNLGNIPDGFFQVACQQACPSGAIVFGDHLDTTSAVHTMREHARTYALLGYLNTRPRTTYMIGVKNPNRGLLEAMKKRGVHGVEERLHLMDEPFGHGGGGSHESDSHAAPTGGGHSHGPDGGAGGRRGFLRDSAKAAADKGYALSLNVLGAFTGVQA
ncbi:MAG: TAT-variant-translocated molybdopterin oxidoreductase [Phycisphaerales bacterium]